MVDNKVHPSGMKISKEFMDGLIGDEPINRSEIAGNQTPPEDIMLGFQNLSISTRTEGHHILTGISGYVKKGGITALIGASGSGKSVLMKLLTGRMPEMYVTGNVTLKGSTIDPHSQGNGMSFTPQEDILIGDITIRETFEVAAGLRCPTTKAERSKSAEDVIGRLGLSRVADNVVGTILKRGLSGGEKRRTCIGQELVVRPSVACLDEPTSGLDGTAAYDVIKTIKNFAEDSEGKFSVLLSVHQPDMRILSLFDHIMLIGNGGSLFFGTVVEAIDHFASLGYSVPFGENPTDYFLNITDNSFKRVERDFKQEFSTSSFGNKVNLALEEAAVLSEMVVNYETTDHNHLATSFFRQISILLKRDAILAIRDPTLYYLQLILHLVYGVMIGLVFYDLKPTFDKPYSYLPGSIVWATMLNSYVHVFKIYYLVTSNKRYEHEKANASYSTFAYYLSELIVTCISQIIFLPGVTIAFFMIGLPVESFPFFLLVLYVTGNVAEGMLSFITKFTENAAYAVVVAQAVLTILTMFAGGIFIPFDDVPDYWNWLSQIGLLTHSTKAVMLHTFHYIDFNCSADKIDSLTGFCNIGQGLLECDVNDGSGNCIVSGESMISELYGADGSPYTSFGYLVILMVVFRALNLFLYYYPFKKMCIRVKEFFTSYIVKDLLEVEMEVLRLRGDVNMLKSQNIEMEEKSAILAQSNEMEIDKFRTRMQSSQRQNSYKESVRFMDDNPRYLVFDNLTVALDSKKGNKVLIDHVSGHATSGRVLALMGPSGAGKTTLLNALSGRATYATVTGSVKLNGKNLSPEDLDYVPQFDDLNDCFTMRELLLYHANLKTTGTKVHKRVVELIHIMGLTPKADVRVSKLSGGERKRVSIAIGLVGEARVLYADEPTTGLDSVAAYSVIKYITKVAMETGVVAIVTIHQPSGQVFSMLQDLMLLERGRLAYFGTRQGALNHFSALGAQCPSNSNPANLYLDLISMPPNLTSGSKSGEITWSDLYKESNFFVGPPPQALEGISEDEHADKKASPGLAKKMVTMLDNYLVYYWRNVAVYWLRLAQLIVVALYIGTVFWQLDSNMSEISNISGASFFNLWCVLFAVIAAAPSFVIDRRIALQEELNGAYTPYMASLVQFCASLPHTIATSIIYQAIFHWAVGLNPAFESFVFAILVTISLLLLMESIMLNIVEVLKEAMLSTTFSMVILGMLFLFPGFFIQTGDLVPIVRWMSYIMPTRYSFNSYLNNVFVGQIYNGMSGEMVLDNYFNDAYDIPKYGYFAAVMCYVLLFRFAHLGLQLYTIKPYMKKSSALLIETFRI